MSKCRHSLLALPAVSLLVKAQRRVWFKTCWAGFSSAHRATDYYWWLFVPKRGSRSTRDLGSKRIPWKLWHGSIDQFLNAVKSGESEIKIPVYSHEVYNIIPDTFEIINQPDILIVEGINTLQLPANQQIYVSDFFDFSIFVDAQPDLIEKWYLERFESLLDTAFQNQTIITISMRLATAVKQSKWQKKYGKMWI